ncbi:MAG: hypothetical protein LBQ59_04850 [Candidatus Peribacteria bacterium]|jgi:hypothetical protein|nr:hypothetical protein [Candidatus Peribacteria bacterium]
MADFLILEDDKKTESNNTLKEDTKANPSISSLEKLNNLLYSFQKIKTKDKVIFYRLLSTMTNA